MMSRLPLPTLFFLVFFLLPAQWLLAQQSPTVHLAGRAMRAPLDVAPGQTTIHLCDLTPGNTYSVTALGMAAGQLATFEIMPTAELQHIIGWQGKKNAVRFTAPAACMDIQVLATELQVVTSIPMFLSVHCESCPRDDRWKNKLLKEMGASVLQVNGGISAADLIRNTLIGGNCFNVINISYAGQAGQLGTFSGGSTNIGFSNGMLLTTGDISVAPGPNDDDNASDGYGIGTPDADLAGLASGGSIVDRAAIEFDFTPTSSSVSFEYVFASEEYCEYVNSQFNDVFGFFISGPGIAGTKNLAVIGASTPVSINTINHLTNSSLYVHNTPFFGTNCFNIPATGPAVNEVQYDGFTKKLTAVVDVIPCQTYHIKLKIADVSDGLWDSGVFLRANSFSAGGAATAEAVYPAGQSFVYENCGTGYVRFVRNSGDIAQPLTINFTVGAASTATPGVDYAPLTSPVIIPAGQNELLVPVTVYGDQLAEGQENIVLLVSNSCSCSQAQVNFLIKDRPTLTVGLDDHIICNGSSATLLPTILGGAAPLSYMWNTGETDASIIVSPGATTTYSVTVSDVCGTTAMASNLVQVLPSVQMTTILTFCPGDSVVLNGTTYSMPDTVVQIFPGANGACDTLLTYILHLLPQPVLHDTITFCSGMTITIGGVVYTGSGIVLDTIPGTNGGCDTLLTSVLQLLPRPAFTDTLNLCQGDSIKLNGVAYSQSGTVSFSIPALTGCDTLATYVLQFAPHPTFTDTLSFCPGDSVTIGGIAYGQPDTIIRRIPAVTGCDTVATYILQFAPQPTVTRSFEFCPGDSVQVNGVIYRHPGTVLVAIPAATGCDTLATFVFSYIQPSGPTAVVIDCPDNITVTAELNASTVPVIYSLPLATTDCPCPGLNMVLQQGLASGSNFPLGTTKVCYSGRDTCGNSATCCFNVSVTETSPCDVKVIGCMKYELLSITEDIKKRKTYRIRTTNTCASRMTYMLVQLPNGVVADLPVNNSIYTAPGGRTYLVRNPNFSPFYSLRYLSVSDSIQNGESDVFKYTLPPQSSPNYIHVTARLETGVFYEAYLNTFFCEIGFDPSTGGNRPDRDAGLPAADQVFNLYPNPTNGVLFANLSAWAGQAVQLRVFNAQGRLIQSAQVQAEEQAQVLELPATLADGLYLLEVTPVRGKPQSRNFSVVH